MKSHTETAEENIKGCEYCYGVPELCLECKAKKNQHIEDLKREREFLKHVSDSKLDFNAKLKTATEWSDIYQALKIYEGEE